MTNDQLARIKAARERNRIAMEQEHAAREQRQREEAEAQARAQAQGPSMMVSMVDLVLGCPGRPLSKGTVARLKEIRLRNAILAEVNRLQSEVK